jgi:HAD superfamily hydrolase (TIGR01509 family)
MIAAVLFDMNDVLYRYDRGRRVARLATLSGRTDAEVEAAIWGSGYEDSGDDGAMDADAYLAGFGARLGFALSEDAWAEALRVAVAPMPETLALAAAASARVKVGVLTNNNLLVKRAANAVFPVLRPIFGANVFVSAEFGARKPQPAAYLGSVARLGATPAETLFVDDSPRNVEGAERAGLIGHLFRGSAALAAALKDLGLTLG